MSEFNGFIDNTKENKTRRKLTIITQTPTEMVVDIDRIEEVSTNATKLNAANLNDMVDSIKGAVKGCVISVNETEVGTLSFNSDPQTQIDTKASTESLNSEQSLRLAADSRLENLIENVMNNLTKLSNTYGGFAAGSGAESGSNGIQLGSGTNNTANSLQVFGDNIFNAATHTLSVQNLNLTGNFQPLTYDVTSFKLWEGNQGSISLNNGLIIKWGLSTGNGEQTVTYNSQFPTATLVLVNGPDSGSTSNASKTWEHGMFYNLSKTGFKWHGADGYQLRWIAVGY